MPSITARICGICPVSHLLASAKACDAIMAVQSPSRRACCASCCTARSSCSRTRSASSTSPRPTCCWASTPTRRSRNVFGLIEEHPGDGARRHRAAQVRPAGHRGAGQGARASVLDRARRRQRAARAGDARPHPGRTCRQRRAIAAAHAGVLQGRGRPVSPKRSQSSATRPPCTPAWWMPPAACSCTTARLRFQRCRRARSMAADPRRATTPDFIGEAAAARLLPEGAVLQAARLSRGHLPRGTAGAAQRGRPLRHARRPTPNSPSSASASAAWCTARSTTTTRA